MPSITIAFLADYPDVIPTLVRWFRAQWPNYFADWSQAEMEQDFAEDAAYDRLPIRLLAFVSGELAGTIILRESNDTIPAEFQPELGGLFVTPLQRGQGVGAELVQAGMNLARELGYEAVYATTVTAVGILERAGWEFVQTVVHSDETLSFYRCTL